MTVHPADARAVPVARPTVLSLVIKEKAALYAAYMPFLKHGGIFVPSPRQFNIGDEVYLAQNGITLRPWCLSIGE